MSSADLNSYKPYVEQPSVTSSAAQSKQQSKALPTEYVKSTQLATNIIAALNISDSTLQKTDFNKKLVKEIDKLDVYMSVLTGVGKEKEFDKRYTKIQNQAKKILVHDLKDQIEKELKIAYPDSMKKRIKDRREEEISDKMAMLEGTLRRRARFSKDLE